MSESIIFRERLNKALMSVQSAVIAGVGGALLSFGTLFVFVGMNLIDYNMILPLIVILGIPNNLIMFFFGLSLISLGLAFSYLSTKFR